MTEAVLTSDAHRNRTSLGTLAALSKLKRCECECGCKRMVGAYLEGSHCYSCLNGRHKK